MARITTATNRATLHTHHPTFARIFPFQRFWSGCTADRRREDRTLRFAIDPELQRNHLESRRIRWLHPVRSLTAGHRSRPQPSRSFDFGVLAPWKFNSGSPSSEVPDGRFREASVYSGRSGEAVLRDRGRSSPKASAEPTSSCLSNVLAARC